MKQALMSAVLLALVGSASAADLTIDVQGLNSTQGEVMVAVFAGAEGWLRKPVAVARQAAAGQTGSAVQLVLKELPEGALAVSVFHDLNGNGQLDRNAMGMPLEPFAFSNNASAAFGPPKFEQARFELKSSARISVTLN